MLEWTRLSDLLGDPSYGELAQRAEAYLLQPSYAGNLSEPFPGMEGTDLNYNTGQFTSVIGGWNGGTDSFYEYLLKQWVYSPGDFDFYRQRWETAVDSTTRYLKSSPSSRPELTFVAAYNATTLQYQSSHCEFLRRIFDTSMLTSHSGWLHRRQFHPRRHHSRQRRLHPHRP